MKISLLKSIAIVGALILLNTSESAAQRNKDDANISPNGGGKGIGKGKPIGGAQGVPIDGGASALLLAGAAYGLKKLRDHQRKNKNNITSL